jgi:hypothetical protein
MTGPYHYRKAEDLLAEIEAENALSAEAETALALRAQAHAALALAAATAVDPDGSGQSGATSQESGTRIPSGMATCPAEGCASQLRPRRWAYADPK